MNGNERKAVRDGLLHAGFKRLYATPDAGDGVYDESWSHEAHPENKVIIEWGDKTPERGSRPTLRQLIERLENDRDTLGSVMEPTVPLDVRNEVLAHLNEVLTLLGPEAAY
jgi:hypothetical protein